MFEELIKYEYNKINENINLLIKSIITEKKSIIHAIDNLIISPSVDAKKIIFNFILLYVNEIKNNTSDDEYLYKNIDEVLARYKSDNTNIVFILYLVVKVIHNYYNDSIFNKYTKTFYNCIHRLYVVGYDQSQEEKILNSIIRHTNISLFNKYSKYVNDNINILKIFFQKKSLYQNSDYLTLMELISLENKDYIAHINFLLKKYDLNKKDETLINKILLTSLLIKYNDYMTTKDVIEHPFFYDKKISNNPKIFKLYQTMNNVSLLKYDQMEIIDIFDYIKNNEYYNTYYNDILKIYGINILFKIYEFYDKINFDKITDLLPFFDLNTIEVLIININYNHSKKMYIDHENNILIIDDNDFNPNLITTLSNQLKFFIQPDLKLKKPSLKIQKDDERYKARKELICQRLDNIRKLKEHKNLEMIKQNEKLLNEKIETEKEEKSLAFLQRENEKIEKDKISERNKFIDYVKKKFIERELFTLKELNDIKSSDNDENIINALTLIYTNKNKKSKDKLKEEWLYIHHLERYKRSIEAETIREQYEKNQEKTDDKSKMNLFIAEDHKNWKEMFETKQRLLRIKEKLSNFIQKYK